MRTIRLYQHDDGRYGVSFGPAQFAIGEPAWHSVPLDVIEPPNEDSNPDDAVWPIVNIDVDAAGKVTNAKLYAPGLPAGNHDVYPVRVPYMDEHTEAWLAVSAALDSVDSDYANGVGVGNGIERAVAAIGRLAARVPADVPVQVAGDLRGHTVLGLGSGDGPTIVALLSRVLRDGTVFVESSIKEPIPSLIASLRTQLRAPATKSPRGER
ncbi:hypothetical protein [Pigmentiphaga sp. CHJ604]|uniref:hypothetical protein n=1 Tax=Pigmentiphaga sp. CHJ604 TaxID=3081984 RepID=UPI0030D03B7D